MHYTHVLLLQVLALRGGRLRLQALRLRRDLSSSSSSSSSSTNNNNGN